MPFAKAMLQYIVVLLDDTSVSYCHYTTLREQRRLIALDDLKAGILFAMKENLMIQFVYPHYDIPEMYRKVIEEIDHINIAPFDNPLEADIIVIDGWESLDSGIFRKEVTYVLRTTKKEFFSSFGLLKDKLSLIGRFNIMITDVETFGDPDFISYNQLLLELADEIKRCKTDGVLPQLNILTDRMMLDRMNNCNAGSENVTLAPNGKFYVCPAFYYDINGYSIGSLKTGLQIKNAQLYNLSHAPLCRNCDAYQCKRCIYLNWKMTQEVNTPSHEQCVVAHIERNTSRYLLSAIRQNEVFLPDKPEIKEITYLDPFEIRTNL